MLSELKPSKYTYTTLPLTLPIKLSEEAAKRAKEEGLEFSSYVVALVLSDLAEKSSSFVILGSDLIA